MSRLQEQRDQKVNELLWSLPTSLGFKVFCLSEGSYEIRSKNCVLGIGFERFESSMTILDLYSPSNPNRKMGYLIIRHIRGIPHTDEGDSTYLFGRKLAENIGDVLSGDFSIQAEYDKLSERILDRMFEVRDLPKDNPIRILFEKCDIQWLYDLEESSPYDGRGNPKTQS